MEDLRNSATEKTRESKIMRYLTNTARDIKEACEAG